MDAVGKHRLLVAQYVSLLAIAERRGLVIPDTPSEEEASKMDDIDLQRWVRAVRDITRTPTD